MSLDFPNSPVAGTVFGAWRYDGTKWGAVSGVSGGGSAGDITAVLAGTGLSGGGTEGDVSIALTVPVTVARGGTGATDAATALTNLGAAPLASPTFTGDPKAPTPATADNDTSIATTAYVKAQSYLTGPVNLTSQVTGVLPIANGGSGSTTAAAAPWVEVGGDTMTGNLTIAPASGEGQMTLATAAGSASTIVGGRPGLPRWVMQIGNGAVESGGQTGNDFQLYRCNDAGTPVDAPVYINRATGKTTFSVAPDITGGASVTANGYVKLPNGLILQWGLCSGGGGAASVSVNFPLAFPTACFSVVATMALDPSTSALMCSVQIMSASSFTAWPRFVAAAGGANIASQPFYWMAIGY